MRLLLHPSDQPVFRLAVRVAQCRLELRVNDVPVYRDQTGAAAAFEMPVNEWLFQGRNTITIHLAPVEAGAAFGKDASLEIVLQHKTARDAHRNLREAGVFRWEPAQMGVHEHHDVEQELPVSEDAPLLALPGMEEELRWQILPARHLKDHAVRVDTVLPLPPPWPACPWTRCAPLSVTTGAQFAVQRMMQTFAEAMRMGGWEQFVSHRRAAVAAAYYLTDMQTDDALGFPALLKERDWQLIPLPAQCLSLELAGTSRLVRWVDEETGESPLVLVNEKEGVAATIDAWWMFSHEWLMIR